MIDHRAIRKLYPTVATIIRDTAYDTEGNIVEYDVADVKAESLRMKDDWDSKEYQRLRAKEYPPVTDYLDAVVKGDLVQQQAYIDACLAVKAKYPK
jgi:hypothetical protein